MKALRVIHGIDSLDPERGGPPMVVASLAAAQAAAGLEVTIAHDSPPESEERIRSVIDGTPHAERVTLRSGPLHATHAAAPRENTLLHLHGFWERPLFEAARAAHAAGAPYVLTPHGMLHPWCLGQKRLKKWLGMRLGYAAMLRRSALIHVLNETEKDIVARLAPRTPAAVIPNGVFLDAVRPPDELGAFRAAHPAIGDNPLVLFMSRLHFKKGLDVLAEAFALALRQRPEMRLAVVGPDDGYEADFRARVARHGVGEAVTIPGPLYGEAKLQALYDADCFCLPSRQEGFSIAITEALACETPCVVSRDCNYPEVAEAGEVTSLDPAEVAAALLRVLSDRQEAKRLGQAGKRLVQERFTWERVAETAIRAYEAIPEA